MIDLQEIEQCRLAQQQRLDRLHSPRRRNCWGQFATCPALAEEMATYAHQLLSTRKMPVRLLEPALGTGVFVSAAMKVFGGQALSQVLGVELDSAFASAARSLWSSLSRSLDIVEDDFTRLPAPDPIGRFDLLLTNPPYVRHHHLSADEKQRLKKRVLEQTGIEISGLAGLYCYFLLLADAWLSPGGLSMWLVPAEFMQVNYGSALRKYLTKKVTLLHIHRYCPEDLQFDDALVSSAVVVFEKSLPPEGHQAKLTHGGSLLEPLQSRRFDIGLLANERKWGSFFQQQQPIRKQQRCRITLGDLFAVKRGLATGNNAFFILPRSKAQQLGVPSCYLRPILPSPRYVRGSIIEEDCQGYPQLERCLALIDCDLSEPEIRRRFPDFWDYLQQGKNSNTHRGYLASRRRPWYSQEQRPPAPFLCTYMGRTNSRRRVFRMLWNRSRATAANVYLMLYPKGELLVAMQERPELQADIFKALQEIQTEEYLGAGRVYGGGLHKIEPAELKRLPADAIAKLVRIR